MNDTTGLYHQQAKTVIYPSAVTTTRVPSNCTLILRLVLRLFAVNHHPVGDLLSPSTLKPLSDSPSCVPHMPDASAAKPVSSSFRPVSGFPNASAECYYRSRRTLGSALGQGRPFSESLGKHQNETANRTYSVLGNFWTYDVIVTRRSPTKDCKGVSGGVASQ